MNELTVEQIRGAVEFLDRLEADVLATITKLRAAGFSEDEQVPTPES